MSIPAPSAFPDESLPTDACFSVEAALTSRAAAGEACYRAAFAISPLPMLVVSAVDGRVIDANAAASRLMGFPVAQLCGCLLAELFTSDFTDNLLTTPAGLEPSAKPIHLLRSDRRATDVTVSVRRFGLPGGERLLMAFNANQDASSAPVVVSAEVDPLTGLPNRIEFDRRLALALERVHRDGRPHFALLFLDLDEFKPINDQFGHTVGDRVLATVARRLAADIRPGDVLSRRGGDEFTVLLESVADAKEARRIAERLWSRAMEPFEVDGHFLHVGASIGVVLGDGTINSPASMIEVADRAMYAAKRAGRPVVHCAN